MVRRTTSPLINFDVLKCCGDFLPRKELVADHGGDVGLQVEEMGHAVGMNPQVEVRDVTASSVHRIDLDRGGEIGSSDVGRPGVEMPAEDVVPLPAGLLLLEGLPLPVRLDDVADCHDVSCPGRERHLRIGRPDG